MGHFSSSTVASVFKKLNFTSKFYIKFLQNLVRAKDHMPEGQTTMRAVTGEQTKFFIGSRDKVVRTENITRQSTRTAYNILTGTALPQPIQAVLSSSQQQQH